MSEHREGWYLERLRDELHRVATLEDERERRPVRGRVLRGARIRP